MQNRYVADVGDFGKFALLNALAGTDLRLGVMWYLNSAEETNADGRFTNYADLKSCDPTLYENLLYMLQNSTRTLSEVETTPILPSGTLFYREPLPFSQSPCFTAPTREKQQQLRGKWFKNGFQELQTANMLFLDPDNGVAGKRVKQYSRRSVKYVFLDEIIGWLNRRQSVVLYQHQKRVPLETQISEQLREFSRCGSPGWALSFHRQSVRIYFILPATKEHRALLWDRTKSFLASQWGESEHFRLRLGD
jgi:hypothetical protein